MKALRFIPLFGILLLIYNIMAFASDEAGSLFVRQVITARLISGSNFVLDVNGILVIIGLNFLYFEIFKSIRTSMSAMVDHALSMIVFIGFLVEFIVVKRMGSQTFLILTIMSLLDVMAGFTISISAARRDVSVAREDSF